jgi:hypothetical protein
MHASFQGAGHPLHQLPVQAPDLCQDSPLSVGTSSRPRSFLDLHVRTAMERSMPPQPPPVRILCYFGAKIYYANLIVLSMYRLNH